MIRSPRARCAGRRGVALVEMAFVSILLFLMLFGIFEYCRLLFVLHVSNNAARDAVRYAVVHTGRGAMPGDPTSVSKQDLIDITTTGKLGTTNIGAGMCGMEKNITGYAVDVFSVDPAGLAQNPPVVQAMSGSPTPAWNAAKFGEKIAVQITGTYAPALPSLVFMNVTIPFKVTVMYNSEAN